MDFRLHTAIQSGYDANGFLGVQVDPYGDENAGTVPVPLFQSIGITSRPAAPADANTGTPVLVGIDGATCLAWCGLDRTVQAKLPTLTEGSTCVYAADGSTIAIDAAANSITIMQKKSGSTIVIDGSGAITITGGNITLTGDVAVSGKTKIGEGGQALLIAPGFVSQWGSVMNSLGSATAPLTGSALATAFSELTTYLGTPEAATTQLTSK